MSNSKIVTEYTLRYGKGCDMSNTDALCRIPLNETFSKPVPIPGEILWLIKSESSTIDARKLKRWNYRDQVMSRVLTFVQSDKAGQVTIQPYFTRKDEITVHKGCHEDNRSLFQSKIEKILELYDMQECVG